MDLEYASVYADLLGDYDKALEFAQKEYQKRPENIDVNRKMAMIYQQKGDMQSAKKHAAVARRTGSRHPELQSLEALLAVK